MERDTHFILGVYDDEDVLLHAVEKVRHKLGIDHAVLHDEI